VLEMVFDGVFFMGLKELWTLSKGGRKRVDLGSIMSRFSLARLLI
jgi:hypothetical protein